MAGATKQAANKKANKDMTLSKDGKALLAKDEGFREYPYNDPRKFCTVGNGVLLHRSPCAEDEKKTKYDADGLNSTFQTRTDEAARYVRHYVAAQSLSQAQFDALTSFVYNVGAGQARDTLQLIDAGEFSSAVEEMGQFVNITVKDKNGNKFVKKQGGLILRREREALPFKPEVGKDAGR